MPSGRRRPDRRKERGALLAGMATMVAILSIFSLVGFQKYADVLRRDREAEMMFRAQEISRAIQRYRLDRGGAAPVKFEDLAEPGTRGQYYIRRLYEDPLVKDGKWGLLYVGPNNQIVDPNADQGQASVDALSGQVGQGAFNQGQVAGQNQPGNTGIGGLGNSGSLNPQNQQGACPPRFA